jgi:hypothetical protein
MSFAKNEQARELSVQFNRINKVQPQLAQRPREKIYIYLLSLFILASIIVSSTLSPFLTIHTTQPREQRGFHR